MMKKIEIPTECPACSYKLEMQEMQLFCRNTACSARMTKQILHFCKTLEIKGMGEKTLEKLDLADITELFALTVDTVTGRLGSAVMANKLVNEIEKAKNASLSNIIASFGVPLIGNTAATKLTSVVTSIDDINTDTCKAAGLGDKATSYLLEFLSGDFAEMRPFLPFKFTSEVTIQQQGETVCITGKLKSFKTKADAEAELQKAGFRVVPTVTKTTNYLVDETDKSSTKRVKADTFGIVIINDLSQFLIENK